MGINKINELFSECRQEGVPLNVELILGLPSETLESWYKTMFGVLEVGQHDSIEVWQAQILENAELNLSQRILYNIIGQKVTDYFPNGIDNEAPEFSEIVTSTSTMDVESMIEGYKLSWFLITWHTGGFSQYISRFIRKYKGESYENFYAKFREFLFKDDFWKKEEMDMSQIIYDWYSNGKEIITELGPITITASTNQYRTLFKIHLKEMYDKMYSLINEFLKSYDLPAELYNELINLNTFVVSKQRDLKNYELKLKFNILEYILNEEVELIKKENNISVIYPHDPERSKDMAWFLESLFFARRRSYGKNYLKVI